MRNGDKKGGGDTKKGEGDTGTERVEDSHKHRNTGRPGGTYSQGQEHRGCRDTQSEGVWDRGTDGSHLPFQH